MRRFQLFLKYFLCWFQYKRILRIGWVFFQLLCWENYYLGTQHFEKGNKMWYIVLRFNMLIFTNIIYPLRSQNHYTAAFYSLYFSLSILEQAINWQRSVQGMSLIWRTHEQRLESQLFFLQLHFTRLLNVDAVVGRLLHCISNFLSSNFQQWFFGEISWYKDIVAK